MAMTLEEWEKAAGPKCPRCGQEVYRFVGGMCVGCYNKQEGDRLEKLALRGEKRYYFQELQRGRLTLRELRKVHLAGQVPGDPSPDIQS